MRKKGQDSGDQAAHIESVAAIRSALPITRPKSCLTEVQLQELNELLAILECDPDSELPDVQTQERELAEAGVSVERGLAKLRDLLNSVKGKI